MRCKNCGWPNKPGMTTCAKCNSPLTSDDDADIVAGAPADMSQPSRPLNKTVMENDVFSSHASGSQEAANPTRMDEAPGLLQCPKCGYPLRGGAEKCPNCRFQLTSGGNPEPAGPTRAEDSADSQLRPTRMATGNSPKGNFRGTVNPYMMQMDVEPSFVLKPIKRMNERHDLEEREYEGKEVMLNRDNTEPNNPSITSREQAVITHSDGRWFIEDKSGQKTTFVQASQKIELHDGDIILLGNRLFEFHK